MTATLNLIEVGNTTHNGDEALDYSYSTLVLLMERGHFIEVSTTYDKDSKRWVSKYTWMWLKTHGLGMTWIPGDAVATNGKPWIRKNPDLYSMDNDTLQAKAHREAVASLLVLNTASVYEPATYMGKPIPNLFAFNVKPDVVDDPILKQEDERRKKRIEELKAQQKPSNLGYDPKKAHEHMDKLMNTVMKGAGVKVEYIPQSDNYALGA